MAGLIIDAGALFEALKGTTVGRAVNDIMLDATSLAAPHCLDVEVLGVIRKEERLGRLDPTAAEQAVEDLAAWPGTRYDHRPFIPRVWQLRHNVRTWDGFYVALAEALDAVLVTTDIRLAQAPGLKCKVGTLQ